MKFWVKAITDDNVQEQLLVKASNSPELMKELGRLLHTHVIWMSVSDFQSQIVEKLDSGAEILPVKIITSKVQGEAHDGESSVTGIDPGTRNPSLVQSEISQVSCRDDGDWPFSSRSPSVSETPLVTRPCPASPSLLIIPQVDRICLVRKDIELLLHPSNGGTYVNVVSGCFVRIRERQDYELYQIIRPSNNKDLVLDMIHYEETRPLEVVSNAPPVAHEVNAWGKKMISASRPFMAPGFIEAKFGDIDSAMRTVRATPQEQSLPVNVVNLPTPPCFARETQGRRRFHNLFARSRLYPYISLGRVDLKTNDVLQHAQISIIEEPEADTFDLVLFATRHSNSVMEKNTLSDFAGCMITLSKSGEPPMIMCDRDVTVKGYEMFCCPQKWDCQYIALAQLQPSVDSVPCSEESKKCVQEFTVLSGRFLTGLFNLPMSTLLPIPTWAQAEGIAASVVRPHLVLHREQMHVFYLIRTLGPHPPQRSSSTRMRLSSTLGNNMSGEGASIGNGQNDDKTAAAVDAATAPMGNVSREGSFCDHSIAGVCRYGLAHAVTTDPKLQRWKLLTEKEPLFSCSHFMPVFTAASTSCFSVVRDSDEGVTQTPKNGEKVVQILWYEEGFLTRQTTVSSHRSSRLSLSSGTLNSSRVPLPFEHLVNAHEEVLPEHWVQEPCYSSIRIDAESLKTGVASLSLSEHDGTAFVACMQRDAQQRFSITFLPVTNEP